MTIIIFKFLHVATISIWAGGLIALPLLYWQRRGLSDDALHGLHAFTRQFYVMLISPAAFIAVGSGTVLIFLRETYTMWFALKLGLIALFVGLHLLSGLLILKLFKPEGHYRLRRFLGETTASVLIATSILVVVLAKPDLRLWTGVEDMLRPGELHRIATDITGWDLP